MVKDLYNTNNIYANDMNKKHSGIVNVLQARLPTKKTRYVTNLYVDIMMEMTK